MKPRALRDDLVQQSIGAELLVYDAKSARACLLNERYLRLWQLCDGRTDIPALARLLGDDLDEAVVSLMIAELQDHGLVQADEDVGRREALKKLVTVAIPVILSVAVPLPAAAASCITLNNACVFNNFNQSNCCPNLRCDQLFPDICRPCFGTGVSFGLGATVAACNLLATKNLCCNSSGTPTVGPGSSCLCP